MKNSFLFILLVFFTGKELSAQQTRSIRVRAGDDLAQAYSTQGFYRFAQFGKAAIRYKDGNISATMQFNYNILSGQMQFIGPKGDTLDLGGQDNIDSVAFENALFIYNDGFLEAITSADSVTLFKKTAIKTQVENIGAYGQPNATASIVNIKTFQATNGVYSLVLNQDVIVIENVSWFFMDKNKNLVKAGKANLSKVFSVAGQAKADTYLKQNKTNFEKENDLKKFMEAINK